MAFQGSYNFCSQRRGLMLGLCRYFGEWLLGLFFFSLIFQQNSITQIASINFSNELGYSVYLPAVFSSCIKSDVLFLLPFFSPPLILVNASLKRISLFFFFLVLTEKQGNRNPASALMYCLGMLCQLGGNGFYLYVAEECKAHHPTILHETGGIFFKKKALSWPLVAWCDVPVLCCKLPRGK